MAIYHLSVKPISRGAGRSATAASAYRAADVVRDVRTGQTFDYEKKRGVEHEEIVLPSAAAKLDINWARDRQGLWNAAEQRENRTNARVAREYVVALPHELDKEQRRELVSGFATEIANRHGVAVDFAIHAPHRAGDQRNWHAHLMATTRVIEAAGLGEKASIEWSDTHRAKAGMGAAKQEITDIRERWATRTNEYLRELGHESRIDHRSLAEQGIERAPTTHLGPAVTAMQRRGMESEVHQRLDVEATTRQLREAAELGRLERDLAAINREIVVVSTDLAAALKERDRGLSKSRGMFDGLRLESPGVAEAKPFAGLILSSESGRMVPARSSDAALHRALDQYGRAWQDLRRMSAQELPVLEHQKAAFEAALIGLEKVRPGAARDLQQAVRHQPTLAKELSLDESQRRQQLLGALQVEAQVRADPQLRAQRVVKEWNALEEKHGQLQRGIDAQPRKAVESKLQELAQSVKQDPPLERELTRVLELEPERGRSRQRGLDISDTLQRVVKARSLERAMELAVPQRERGLSL